MWKSKEAMDENRERGSWRQGFLPFFDCNKVILFYELLSSVPVNYSSSDKETAILRYLIDSWCHSRDHTVY